MIASAPARRATRLRQPTVLSDRVCEFCDRRFTKPEHLRRHQRSHTGEKPFGCQHCGRKYGRSDVLIRHIKKHHSGDTDSPNPSSISNTALYVAPYSESSSCGLTDEMHLDNTTGPNHLTRNHSGDGRVHDSDPSLRSSRTRRFHPEPDFMESIPSFVDEHVQETDHLLHPLVSREGLHDTTGTLDPLHWSQALSEGDTSSILDHVFPRTPRLDWALHMDGSIDWPPGLQDAALNEHQHTTISIERLVDSRNSTRSNLNTNNVGQFEISNGSNTARPPGSRRLNSRSTTGINRQSWAMVNSLWPTIKNISEPQQKKVQWGEVASHGLENIFANRISSTVSTSYCCDVDDNFRNALIEYCTIIPSSEEGSTTSRSPPCSISGQSPATTDTGPEASANFPQLQTLQLCLDLFFRQFHNLLPFIHKATFDANVAPTSLVVPMYLIGYTIMAGESARPLIDTHHRKAVQRCRLELQSAKMYGCPSPRLLTLLASGALLLNFALFDGHRAYEETSLLLRRELMGIAQLNGLFSHEDGESIDLALGAVSAHEGETPIANSAPFRIESILRLTTLLIMTEAYYSHVLSAKPTIEPGTIKIVLPENPEGFMDPGRKALQPTPWTNSSPRAIFTLSTSTVLPDVVDDFTLYGLLSAIWLSILKTKAQARRTQKIDNDAAISSADVAIDEQRAQVAILLQQCYSKYVQTFQSGNMNCAILWNGMWLELITNLGMFEDAVGRHGADRAINALAEISAWAKTAAARRAILHAAQTYYFMLQRKPSHGMMLHSECLLFQSALVLGLYVHAMPHDDLRDEEPMREPFELVELMDWSAIGDAGLSLETQLTTVEAQRFINEGGSITFNGLLLTPGYHSARSVIIDYICLLHEVGKWNLDFSHLLRALWSGMINTEKT